MEPGGFVTKGTDRKSRLDQRQASIAAAAGGPGDVEEEDETEQEKLEHEVNKLTSQLKRAERAKEQARDKEERDKARRFSTPITEGCYLKQPKAVTFVQTRKRKKSMKTENIRSSDKEDETDDIPEGFHLQEESPYCINMKRAEDYQAYLQQVVLQFEQLLKTGGTDIRESYGQVIESMFWAVKANKQTIFKRCGSR